MQEGIRKGIKEGIKEGRFSGLAHVASVMLRAGEEPEKISAYTGLTVEQIHAIK